MLKIIDNFTIQSLKHIGRGESFDFSTLQLSNITIFFLPPNVISVVQFLDHALIASFKIQYKKKLLEHVLSQFDYSTTHRNLRKIVPNVSHVIMYALNRGLNPQIIRNI